ncbi:gliding motility-associated C-terminal domain-containing protein [Mucilaginibacter arboris]|uniref:T9SS type B sorting domain-containing protein n=1 Tax=Mucilaginibacter arboris TaxID=2682090 RepID=A0A7K1STB5_9SPHI|nr:gliding motility-associated C-terminal domain-containing protein [Mucilaginibacter arboris]MVN20535.1 T9SS type B sorting domain-containing protein [Mucilaginibacter arboris]
MKQLRILLLSVFFLGLSAALKAQAPVNDDCSGAIALTNVSNFCSDNAAYTNVNATAGGLAKSQAWPSEGNDVWFKFIATAFDVNISVTGNANGGGTLTSPLIALYTTPDCSNFTELIGSNTSTTTLGTLYKGGLTIGQTYYIRVSGANTGTFKLCINNYFPILKAGQDFGSASIICDTTAFTQTNVTGAGTNNRESAGTCLDVNSGNGPIEANSAWYKWTAANNGTLTFTITPTISDNDIDWVLYDLGTSGAASNVTAANAIRCASGSGIGCTPFYNKTGLNLTSTDLVEMPGCVAGQDGFVKYVDMIQGHVYALLINNFTSGSNGFTISFTGSGATTGTFLGPTAKLDMQVNNACTASPSFTFTNKSTNYTSLKWSFGDGASIDSAAGPGPYTVTYSTPGTKTAVLLAYNAQGCLTVDYKTFDIPAKPAIPVVLSAKNSYCLGDNLVLRAQVPSAKTTYAWQGPNGFTSTDSVVTIPITNYNQAGTYTLAITQNGCTSDQASITIPPIGKTPVLNFTITPNNLCTNQQSFTITNNSTDYTSLKWDFGTDASITSATTNGPFTITYASFGNKKITLTAVGMLGCTSVISQNVNVPQKPVVTQLNKVNGPYCIGDTLVMSTTAQANTIYSWTGPNNFTSNQTVVRIPITGPSVAGTYALTITQGQCSSDPVGTTINLSDIVPVPVAAFDVTPTIPLSASVPLTVSFKNLSTNADSYLWDFGDGTTSTAVNPQHTYTTKGNFTVKLTATNKGACSNTISLGKLILRYNVTIFIPNTFTPNGDGINDDFGVKITNLKNYRIQIFNRYGTQLYEAKDILKRWDGLYNGEPVPVGTYYYVITATTLNDDLLKEAGYVTVIR